MFSGTSPASGLRRALELGPGATAVPPPVRRGLTVPVTQCHAMQGSGGPGGREGG